MDREISVQPDSIQTTHAQRRATARTRLQPLRREFSELAMTGVIGANGAGRRTFGFRLRPRFGRRDEMGSSPSHEHDDASESGAHANITVDVFLSASHAPT
jgi:hypothetical protein